MFLAELPGCVGLRGLVQVVFDAVDLKIAAVVVLFLVFGVLLEALDGVVGSPVEEVVFSAVEGGVAVFLVVAVDLVRACAAAFAGAGAFAAAGAGGCAGLCDRVGDRVADGVAEAQGGGGAHGVDSREVSGFEAFLTRHQGKFDFVQIQLNYLDWTLQDAKTKYEIIARHGPGVWVMEPLIIHAAKGSRPTILKSELPGVPPFSYIPDCI